MSWIPQSTRIFQWDIKVPGKTELARSHRLLLWQHDKHVIMEKKNFLNLCHRSLTLIQEFKYSALLRQKYVGLAKWLSGKRHMLPRLTTQMPRKYIAGRNSLLPAVVMHVNTRHINKVGGKLNALIVSHSQNPPLNQKTSNSSLTELSLTTSNHNLNIIQYSSTQQSCRTNSQQQQGSAQWKT